MTPSALSYQFDVTPELRASVQRALAARSKWYRRMQYAYVVLPLVFVGLSLWSGKSVVALTNTTFEGMAGRFTTDVRDAVYG